MTKFFKKSQNPYFWFHFGQNKISWKKGLCQFLGIPIIYHRAKNQAKIMSYFWEKRRTDGRTDGQTYRQSWFYRTLLSQGSKKPLQFYNCHDKSATELCRHDQYNFTPGDWCLLPKKVLQNILNFKSSFAIKILDKKCNIFLIKIQVLLQRKKTTKTSTFIYPFCLFLLKLYP